MREEKMTAELSLDGILDDLSFETVDHKGETTLSVWVPVEIKERYKVLQKRTGKKLAGKLREIIVAAIEKAESRAS